MPETQLSLKAGLLLCIVCFGCGSLSGGVFVSGTLTTLSAARLLTLQDNQRVMANIGSAASIGDAACLQAFSVFLFVSFESLASVEDL